MVKKLDMPVALGIGKCIYFRLKILCLYVFNKLMIQVSVLETFMIDTGCI